MTVSIESVNGKDYIVRCLDPSSPPFRKTEIYTTIQAALEAAKAMLEFPEIEE